MANRPKKQKLDSRDVEGLKSLLESRGYALVKARIIHMVGVEQRLLEQYIDVLDTAKARSALQTLRAVLEIPDILLREAKASPAPIDEEV